MGAPRAVQSYFRVSDRDLTHNYSVMRQGVFTSRKRTRVWTRRSTARSADGAGRADHYAVSIAGQEQGQYCCASCRADDDAIW
eukprot:11938054-Heterocapsa_arctica.AAC.1